MGGVILLLLALLCLHSSAQTTTTADRWKGTKVEDIKAADIDYKNKEIKAEGKKFYLYNVGTGKFVSRGGDFGIRAYMTNRDFGCSMYLGKSTALKNYTTDENGNEIKDDAHQIPDLIFSGIVGWAEGNSNNYFPYALGINYPGHTTKNGSWGDGDATQTYGPILQATPEMKKFDGNDWLRSKFYFERVETDPDADTFTYRLLERMDKGNGSGGWDPKYCYLGAVAGLNPEDGKSATNLGKEQVTFTEVTEGQACPNKTHYYEWRLVTEDEINKLMEKTTSAVYGGGLLANVTTIVSDPFFYNGLDDDFKNGWSVTSMSTDTELNRFEWASDAAEDKGVRIHKFSDDVQGSFSTSKHWNEAVLRKIEFNAKDDAKYSFALFDGVGQCSQTVIVPKAGYYVVQCRGLYQGNTAYLFANGQQNAFPESTTLTKAVFDSNFGVNGGDTNDKYLYYGDQDDYTKKGVNDKKGGGWGSNYLASEFRMQWQDATASMSGLRNIGSTLYDNSMAETSVLVKVEADNGTIIFGVKKEQATKQDVQKLYHKRHVNGLAQWGEYDTGYEDYYYDSDIAAFDNIQIYYLGTEQPYVFDEGNAEETEVSGKFSQQEMGNKATFLKRSLKKDTWEPIVVPFDMTMAQVREYFGEEAQVAKLNGVNTLTSTDKAVTIDFKTVALENEMGVIELQKAIEAGQFYLIKATKEAHATQSITQSDDNYIVGRHDYTGSVPENTHSYTINVDDDCNQLTAHGSYWKTTQAVKPGQYYFNSGTLYRSSSTYDIKGFRGWLSAQNVVTGAPAKIAFDFDSDNAVTFIDGVSVKPEASVMNVYTVGGQLVRRNSTSTDGLPRGMYIVNGKKVIVK